MEGQLQNAIYWADCNLQITTRGGLVEVGTRAAGADYELTDAVGLCISVGVLPSPSFVLVQVPIHDDMDIIGVQCVPDCFKPIAILLVAGACGVTQEWVWVVWVAEVATKRRGSEIRDMPERDGAHSSVASQVILKPKLLRRAITAAADILARTVDHDHVPALVVAVVALVAVPRRPREDANTIEVVEVALRRAVREGVGVSDGLSVFMISRCRARAALEITPGGIVTIRKNVGATLCKARRQGVAIGVRQVPEGEYCARDAAQ